jgi:hypothetical protein
MGCCTDLIGWRILVKKNNGPLHVAIGVLALFTGICSGSAPAAPATDVSSSLVEHDAPKLELVMQLVVTCSDPESLGGDATSKDGKRTEIWPIVGGRFQGKGIRGTVIAGGGDFPVTRPDGVEVVDALYRLRTDDGVTIIIHNKGLGYPDNTDEHWHYRLSPEFTAPTGKYEWLNNQLFIANLVDVPAAMRLAKGPKENDRLIQVYRVL